MTSEPQDVNRARTRSRTDFTSIGSKWLLFLGRLEDTPAQVPFADQLDAFLRYIRDERGLSEGTVVCRRRSLEGFFSLALFPRRFDWDGHSRVDHAVFQRAEGARLETSNDQVSWRHLSVLLSVREFPELVRLRPGCHDPRPADVCVRTPTARACLDRCISSISIWPGFQWTLT